MGYHFYITRNVDQADSSGSGITDDEWLDTARADPELVVSWFQNVPNFALWIKSPDHNTPWIDFDESTGAYAKYTSEPLLIKMLAIAVQLRACVKGQKGEIYTLGDDGLVYVKRADEFVQFSASPESETIFNPLQAWLRHLTKCWIGHASQ